MAFELAFYIAGCDIQAGDMLMLDPETGKAVPYIILPIIGCAKRDYSKDEQVLIHLPIARMPEST